MPNKSKLARQYLNVTVDAVGVVVAYDFPWSMTLGCEARKKELRRRLKAKIERWGPTTKLYEPERITASFLGANSENAWAAIRGVEEMLDDFADEKLTPKMVEEILGITSKERLRWTKDGRLPKSGTGSFKKGRQVFQFYLHPVKQIAEIAANSAILRSWRDADATKYSDRKGD